MPAFDGWRLLLLWSVVFCVGCSPIDASNREGPVTPDEAAMMKEFEGLVKKKGIVEGSYRSLRIGASKDQALASLREIGVASIEPGLGEQVAVKKPEDLSKLQDAEGIIIGAGEVTIAFDGNDVVRVTVAPIFPEWNTLLHGVRTKQEAFRALTQILEESKDVEIRALAVDAENVSIRHMTPKGRVLLEKYNHWEIAHDTEDGYIHMNLEFAHGALRKISVLEAPSAL